jgi:corrinoid protein of di/trimethylamine methyltransferase
MTPATPNFAAMRQSVIDGAPEAASALAKEAIGEGLDPLAVIDSGFVPGMAEVGEQFAKHQMYLPDMLAAAEAMKAAMDVLEPALRKMGEERPTAGTVILGTTKGDIHEIGKTLVGTLLTANGFKVYDLGVDVAPEQFAGKAREFNADIVGVSALLTTTMRGQRAVVEAIQNAGLRASVKTIVGGAPVTQRWADEIGADGYAKDAISAVELVRNLLRDKPVRATVSA